MGEHGLLHLARDLEWLGCELEYYGHQHAIEGFPGAGPAWSAFVEKQKGVLRTADKIERELKNEIRYNPAPLVGVHYPLDEALESVTLLLAAVEDVKQTVVSAVHDLPAKVRDFTRRVERHVSAASALHE